MLESIRTNFVDAIAGLTTKMKVWPRRPRNGLARAAQLAASAQGPDSLTSLADRHGSDKGSSKHEYTKVYELLFHNLRSEPLLLVEMGLQIGGPEHNAPAERVTDDLPSVRMWLDYFPHGQVIGADISDFSWFKHNRFSFIQCDMALRANFAPLCEVARGARIIIDDASHASAHQQFGLLELFPVLEPGGIYVIEDLQWQPSSYEKRRPRFPKTSALFRAYLRDGFFRHPVQDIEDCLNELSAEFAGVFLFQQKYVPYARDKMLVIQKKLR